MIESLVKDFRPISLQDMDSVSLMDRTDTKFMFHIDRLPEILEALKGEYHILEIESKRNFAYRSLYYDTDKLTFYNKHHAGFADRYKVRYREYVETGDVFFEIKHRSNKGRTQKKRIHLDELALSLDETTQNFLSEKTNGIDLNIKPQLWINFHRITLVNTVQPERVTLDTNLSFELDGKITGFDNLVIAESKVDRTTRSAFVKCMKNLHIRKGSVSKYCLGIIHMFPEVKSNRFKTKIHNLNKVINEHATPFDE